MTSPFSLYSSLLACFKFGIRIRKRRKKGNEQDGMIIFFSRMLTGENEKTNVS